MVKIVKVLTEQSAEDLLESNGFPVIERQRVHNKKQLRIAVYNLGPLVVLKNPFVLHKTEKNAVKTGVTAATCERAYNSLRTKKVLVQKQLMGIEFLIGIKRDPVFGHVICIGSGGVFTEVWRDAAFRVAPLSRSDAESMLSEVKMGKLFESGRGKKFQRQALLNILFKLNKLIRGYPHIEELDMNPVMVTHDDAQIVDARIVFSPAIHKTHKT